MTFTEKIEEYEKNEKKLVEPINKLNRFELSIDLSNLIYYSSWHLVLLFVLFHLGTY